MILVRSTYVLFLLVGVVAMTLSNNEKRNLQKYLALYLTECQKKSIL